MVFMQNVNLFDCVALDLIVIYIIIKVRIFAQCAQRILDKIAKPFKDTFPG